jgi:predicted nucleic acid-binding protein
MGLILVDSSVWIDFLRSRSTLQTIAVRNLTAARHRLGIGDLMLMEVLQGARSATEFERAAAFLDAFQPVVVGDHAVSRQAARHYRTLRTLGITIRKTIDTLIATRCILDGIPLLYSDRDFDPFVRHLGLRSALDLPGAT